MFKIQNEEINQIVHDLLHVAGILKCVENGSLTDGQRQILHGCELRLQEIRSYILQSLQEIEEICNGNKQG